jgi:hypothetical protein
MKQVPDGLFLPVAAQFETSSWAPRCLAQGTSHCYDTGHLGSPSDFKQNKTMCYQTVGHKTFFENVDLTKRISVIKLKFKRRAKDLVHFSVTQHSRVHTEKLTVNKDESGPHPRIILIYYMQVC